MEYVVVVAGSPPSVYGPFPDEEAADRWAYDAAEVDSLAGRIWVAPLEHPAAFEPPL
jgi:hypothetical protein